MILPDLFTFNIFVMEKNLTIKFVSILLAISVLFASCASSTLIQSYPSGAKVYINGEQVGATPYWYSDTKIIGSVTNIDLIKEGYEPLYTSIERNEQVDVGAVIGGFCLWFPFLWTMQYKATHNYELVPLMQQFLPSTLEVVAPQPTEQPIQIQPVSSKAQRLKELKQLLEEKLITKEDFEKQKQKILDEK